jgi:SAM-dependent methyltransferase
MPSSVTRTMKHYDERKQRLSSDRIFAEYPEVQQIRYSALLRNLGMEPKARPRILDIGCGRGDLFEYLLSREVLPKYYLGVDPWEPGIAEAAERFRVWESIAKFDVISIQKIKETYATWQGATPFEFVFALSVFSHRAGWLSEVEALFLDTVDLAFQLCSKACVLTAKSIFKTEAQPDEAVFDPMQLFAIGRRVTERVLLDHSYAPYEAMLVLFKEKSDFRKLWESKKTWGE